LKKREHTTDARLDEKERDQSTTFSVIEGNRKLQSCYDRDGQC